MRNKSKQEAALPHKAQRVQRA